MAELYKTLLFSDANLVAYWRMEGNSNDSKGSNNGTDTSITYSAANGKFGQGALFNGTNSRIQAPDSASLSLTGNYSINSWINPASLPSSGNFANILNKYDVVATVTSGFDCKLQNIAGVHSIDFTHGKSSGAVSITITKTVPINSWSMITIVYDGTKTYLYFNGELLGSTPATVNSPDNSKAFNIGNFGYYTPSSGELGRYFTGKIDDISVFNRALTATEILSLYGNPSGASPLLFGGGVTIG